MRYLKTIGINSNQPIGRGFNFPYDISFSKDGRIFLINRASVADVTRRATRIQIFDFDEEWLGEFASSGRYPVGETKDLFRSPVSISFDQQDRVYITDEILNEVKVFDSNGNFLNKWGAEKGSGHELDGPSGIAHGLDGTVFVVEQFANRVSNLTKDGELIHSWGSFGSDPGQFDTPWGVTVDVKGNVYVADWKNDRIQKFRSDGLFLESFGQSGNGKGQFHRPSSVAVDSKGVIFVADWGNERVQVLDPNGNCVQILHGEATLSKWAEEWLEVNQDEYDLRKSSNLSVKDLPKHLQSIYHVSSQTEPLFWGPVSVKLDSEERLFVTEHSRHRIQIYEQS